MLKPLGANQNQVTSSNGTIVLMSYETPVAAFIPGQGVIRTSKKWSATTSKHINKWLQQFSPNVTITEVYQSVLDNYQVEITLR